MPDAALALIARGGRGRLPRRRVDARPARLGDRTARSRCRTCSRCSARSRTRCSSGSATSSSTRTPPGALVLLEELSEQGQDLGRLVIDLLEHLRHLMLVQHTGEVPGHAARDRRGPRAPARAGKPARPRPTVVRLIDLLHVAVDDMRQGGDPRLPLELALVKVTRAGDRISHASRSPSASSGSSRDGLLRPPSGPRPHRPLAPRPEPQHRQLRRPAAPKPPAAEAPASESPRTADTPGSGIYSSDRRRSPGDGAAAPAEGSAPARPEHRQRRRRRCRRRRRSSRRRSSSSSCRRRGGARCCRPSSSASPAACLPQRCSPRLTRRCSKVTR